MRVDHRLLVMFNVPRGVLYVAIAILAVATAVLSYQLYQDRKQATGIQINIGEKGVSIEKK